MAATMTFAACSNDEKITESAPKTVALTVKLPEFGGASRVELLKMKLRQVIK